LGFALTRSENLTENLLIFKSAVRQLKAHTTHTHTTHTVLSQFMHTLGIYIYILIYMYIDPLSRLCPSINNIWEP